MGPEDSRSQETETTATPKPRKSEQTRAKILETALVLFRERGYEETTMRAIAEEAGVAVGNAYYYFKSKEHLIQAFYERTHHEHLAASREVLDRERGLRERLLGVMQAKLDTIEPYHRFAGVLFKTAANPSSPLNPFSDESLPVRRQSTELFAELIAGADTRLTAELTAELPNLLWIYHMGIILYWIHDTSPGCAKSYRLMERSAKLVLRLISLFQLPVLRPFLKELLAMVSLLRVEAPSEAAVSTVE
ncbi:MAG TPA: TetR family transcriptional regulator [Thermoanaerobaculia bacterium]|jgi:AcrR family transcriptional regulator|nr:TetR family transcriptional regulator [Thermoanaerobaculia bacterium]